MSKYGVDHRRASRKSEIDNDQSSFLQEKHYSFSKASQLESKQADVSGRKSSQEKEPILDFLAESNDSKATENVKIQQQTGGNKGSVFEEIGEEKEAEAETQRDGKEIFKSAINSSTVPSERMFSFFERSKDVMVSLSKIKMDQLWKALKKKAVNKRNGQKEKLEDGGIVAEKEEQEDLLKEKTDKNKSYAKLSQQQDFGNISEIEERKYPRMDDESAQDEEFQSLLNNNNNNLNKILINNNENNSSIPLIENQSKEENPQNEMDNRFPQDEDKKIDNSKISNDSPSKQGGKQKESPQKHHKSVENLGESQYEQNEEEKSKSSRGAKDLDQKRRLEEANKRKRQLEAELRELEGEIVEIANPQMKKKPKQKQPTRKGQNAEENDGVSQQQVEQNENDNAPEKINQKDRFAIAEDKGAQESALDLVRRMNQARKEKEQKSIKDRLQFGKIIQEDLRESVERAQQLKEKAQNERKERINSKIEQMRMRSQERRILNKESNSIIKEIQHDLRISDPTERYKQEVELPELERRKQELAEKRKMYKPIGIEEIRDHAKRHDEEIRLRKLQAKTNILAEYGANLELQSLPKSHALHKVLEQDKQFKMKDVLEMQKKKEQIERRKEYAKLVKEVHVPRVKQKNFDEQQFYGGINEDPENEYSVGYNNYPQRQLPPKPKRPVINYPPLKKAKPFSQNPGGSESSKNLTPSSGVGRIPNSTKKSQNRGDNLDRSSEQTFNEAAGMGTSKTSPLQNEFDPRGFEPFEENNSNFENQHNNNFSQPHSGKQAFSTYSSGSRQRPPKSKPFEEQEVYRPPIKKNGSDYISILRKQREATEQKIGKKAKIEDWEKYKYDPSLSQKEKYSYILQSAARLEHNAKLKEMQNHMNPELQEQANDLYIDSIKAKLALLDNLNK